MDRVTIVQGHQNEAVDKRWDSIKQLILPYESYLMQLVKTDPAEGTDILLHRHFLLKTLQSPGSPVILPNPGMLPLFIASLSILAYAMTDIDAKVATLRGWNSHL